jgi:ubiquinone/menaquinone biosynthesis C-methylase UbiE
MDSVYRLNKDRWDALVEAKALFTRPWLSETPQSARKRLDPAGRLGDLSDNDVLCLAGGGGQQSVAFALNGSRVSVFDISEGQLQRDLEAARHYGYAVSTFQGDMRDLSVLQCGAFDIVSQPYSLNFVPDCRDVFAQVARVLRLGGLYAFWAANPFAAGLGTHSWNGRAYEINLLYQQGGAIEYKDEAWVFPSGSSATRPNGPREYRHLLSTLLNGLIDSGFALLHIEEETGHERTDDLTPGEWNHFTAVMPPWLSFLARLDEQQGSSAFGGNGQRTSRRSASGLPER